MTLTEDLIKTIYEENHSIAPSIERVELKKSTKKTLDDYFLNITEKDFNELLCALKYNKYTMTSSEKDELLMKDRYVYCGKFIPKKITGYENENDKSYDYDWPQKNHMYDYAFNVFVTVLINYLKITKTSIYQMNDTTDSLQNYSRYITKYPTDDDEPRFQQDLKMIKSLVSTFLIDHGMFSNKKRAFNNFSGGKRKRTTKKRTKINSKIRSRRRSRRH